MPYRRGLNSLVEYGRDEAVRRKALPLMTELHAKFDETVNLGSARGNLYPLRARGGDDATVALDCEARRP